MDELFSCDNAFFLQIKGFFEACCSAPRALRVQVRSTRAGTKMVRTSLASLMVATQPGKKQNLNEPTALYGAALYGAGWFQRMKKPGPRAGSSSILYV